MKRTTQTISWILVLSALTVAACGDRSESHTRIRKGDTTQFNEKLPNANKALSGYWIEETQPSSDQHVTRISYWIIDLEKNMLSANMLCETDGSLKGVVASGQSNIQVNAEQLDLRNPQDKSVSLDIEKTKGSKIDCLLNEKKALLTYKLDGDHLEVADPDNQSTSTRKFCRANWDEENQRPDPSGACQKTNDSTPNEKVQIPEVLELNEYESAEAKSTLNEEGPILDKIRAPSIRWKHNLKEKNGISSYLIMDLTKFNESDMIVLTKVCALTKDRKSPPGKAQVSQKAIFSGKAIRPLEVGHNKEPDNKKPACELKVSKKAMAYILTDDTLTIETDRGQETYNAMKATPAETTNTTEQN